MSWYDPCPKCGEPRRDCECPFEPPYVTSRVVLTRKEINTIALLKHIFKVAEIDNHAQIFTGTERDMLSNSALRVIDVLEKEIAPKFLLPEENIEHLDVDYKLDHAIVDYPMAPKRKMFYKEEY